MKIATLCVATPLIEEETAVSATVADINALLETDCPWIDRAASRQAGKAARAAHASGRARLVDPTTCERNYSADEMEFLNAMQEYKRESNRQFPTWSEALEVLRGLGYRKP